MAILGLLALARMPRSWYRRDEIGLCFCMVQVLRQETSNPCNIKTWPTNFESNSGQGHVRIRLVNPGLVPAFDTT